MCEHECPVHTVTQLQVEIKASYLALTFTLPAIAVVLLPLGREFMAIGS